MQPDQSDRLICLHIPKTAGVSFRKLLERQYVGVPTFLRGAPHFLELLAMSRAQREPYRVVGGHFRFGLHLLFDSPSRYITFVRDPVERVISNFAYVRWQSGHPWHARVLAAGLSLEQWVRLGRAGAADNIQVRWLALRSDDEVPFGETTRQMLDDAKRVLSERIEFLGITERYEESIRWIGEKLHWTAPVTVDRLNVSPNRIAAADMPSSTRDAILEHNALDMELYSFALDLFARRTAPPDLPQPQGLPARPTGPLEAIARSQERSA